MADKAARADENKALAVARSRSAADVQSLFMYREESQTLMMPKKQVHHQCVVSKSSSSSQFPAFFRTNSEVLAAETYRHQKYLHLRRMYDNLVGES